MDLTVLTAREVGAILKRSEKWVRANGAAIGGRKRGNRWLFLAENVRRFVAPDDDAAAQRRGEIPVVAVTKTTAQKAEKHGLDDLLR